MRFGSYELGELISADGTTEVHAASCALDEAPAQVALTRFDASLGADPEFIQFFEVEARFALSLTHPHIAETYDFGSVGGVCYCAGQLIRGIDIASLLGRARARGSRLPVGMAVQICLAVAEALAHAHGREDEARSASLHGSINPRNIYLTFDGEVKLGDYGLAQAKAFAAERMECWQISDCGYLAPEQIAGDASDSRADLFSLGAVLHELMTGSPLFIADSLEETLRQVLDKKVVAPSRANAEVPESLDDIVKKSLSRDMALRYQTAGELCDELFAFAHADSTVVMSPDLARWLDELAHSGDLAWPTGGQVLVTPGRGQAYEVDESRDAIVDEATETIPDAPPPGAVAAPDDASEDDSPDLPDLVGGNDDYSATMKRPRRTHPSFSEAFERSTVRDSKMAMRPLREDSRISRVHDAAPIAMLGRDSSEIPRPAGPANPVISFGLEGPLQAESTAVDLDPPSGMLPDDDSYALGTGDLEITNDAGDSPSYSQRAVTDTRYPSDSNELDPPRDGDLTPNSEEPLGAESDFETDARTTQKRSASAERDLSSDSLSRWRWLALLLVLLMLVAGGVGAYFLAKRKRAAKQRANSTELLLDDRAAP